MIKRDTKKKQKEGKSLTASIVQMYDTACTIRYKTVAVAKRVNSELKHGVPVNATIRLFI